MPEMDENPAEILIVLLKPMIQRFYVRPQEIPQDTFFKLP
jgi:hypothetical protein